MMTGATLGIERLECLKHCIKHADESEGKTSTLTVLSELVCYII